jgi:hypothetical protein
VRFQGHIRLNSFALIHQHKDRITMKYWLSVFAFIAAVAGSAIVPASAQEVNIVVDSHGVPAYQTWQAQWDHHQFDRRHVILGTVANFEPFRLQVARRNGSVQMIDLKNGTIILPTGTTPMTNERVAVVGYYSHGTFIANRVLVRS